MQQPAQLVDYRSPSEALQTISTARTRDADHRIANSLMLASSLLRLRGREVAKRPVVTGSEAKRILEDAAARVDAVSELHRMLSHTPDACDSGEYLRRVGNASMKMCDGTPIRLHYDLADNLMLDPQRMMALGLLTSEAIINALKHAHPTGVAGEIRVSFRQFGNDAMLVIEDDGVGLPEDFDTATDGNLGFMSLRQLAHQLKARLNHQSTPLGLRTEVLFAL